jgi:pimeloyl-ACP methyl ester carboxylesterase
VSLPGTFVDSSAGRIFVHRGGARENATPLVLIHGWMMSHYYFRPIVETLAQEHELIALDLPGHGESDRPSPSAFAYDFGAFAGIVDEVMGKLGIASADILGASMGGGTALALAARHPSRVNKLVLAAAAAYPPPALPLDAKLALLPGVGPFLFKNVFGRREFERANRQQAVRDPRSLDDAWIDYYWDRFNRAGARDAFYACMQLICSLPNENRDAANIQAPTLLVWGDEDRLVPLSRGKQLARAIAGARLEVIPACGHMPFIERPEQFLRAVRPFLSTSRPVEQPRAAHSA